METRIPIEAFSNFDKCILDGYTFGIRWSAAMEAYDAARKHTPAPRARIQHNSNQRHVCIGAIGSSSTTAPSTSR